MDLDADAVEVGVDADEAARLGHRGSDVGGAGGQHRQHRASDLEPDRGERGLALECRPRDRDGAAREHRRAAYGLQRRAGRRRQSLLHQRVERALPDVARDHPTQPALLVAGGAGEETGYGSLASALGPAAGERGEVLEGRVHLRDSQARLVDGWRG